MRSLTIEIPGRPPTPNSRRHWTAVARDNAAWEEKAQLAAVRAMREAEAALTALDPTAYANWPLDIVREERTLRSGRVEPALWACTRPILYAVQYVQAFVVPDERDRDWDNAVASGKPITDGLVKAGVLAGDSTRYIDSEGRRVLLIHQSHLSKVVVKVVEGEPPGTLGLA